jgi:predicted PurR-regulated permease PerM
MSTRPNWHASDVVRTTALAAAVVIALVAAWYASTILLFAFLGVLLGLPLAAGVDRLAKYRIPRPLGALILVTAVLVALAATGAALAPTLSTQTEEIRSRLPEAVAKIQEGLKGRFVGGQSISSQLSSGVTQVARHAIGVIGSTVELVIYLLLVLFIAVYMAVDPDLYYLGMLHLVPHPHRERAAQVLSSMAAVMRRWLLTQCVAMATIGLLWGIALTVLRVKAALALAVIAGILEFVPTIGPTIAAIPALAIGFLDSPEKALYVLLVYLGVQGIESNILIPVLMKGQIDLPPALTIVWQALMALAFGFLGLLVAVPLLAAVLVAVKMLYVRDVVGDQVALGHAAEGSGKTTG